MSQLETIFFIHVPKTAGTSFRVALTQTFPRRLLAFDYGARSPETTDWVRQHTHDTPDRERFRRELTERGIVAFGGHVGRPHYGDVFPPEKTIAFLRDPVDRVISEWHHHRRNSGLGDTLDQFAEAKQYRNTQARLLRGAEPETYAALGLTARYRESLTLVSQKLGWELPLLALNRNPQRAELGATYDVTDELRTRIAELNQADVQLFQAAESLFASDMRSAAPPSLQPPESIPSFPARTRGFIDGYDRGHVYGWACRVGDATPLTVRVLLNGREVAVATADLPRPDLYQKQIHPTGNAGFRVAITPSPTNGAVIRCIAEPGSIELSHSPYHVT